MATKKKIPQWQIDALGLGLSFVGGGLSSWGMTQANLKIKRFEEMPSLAPLSSGFVGAVLVFLLPIAAKPLGHGMTGVSGGSVSDMALNGLSRIEIQGDEIQGHIEDAEDEIENLSKVNEAIQRAAEDVEFEMSDDDGTN